VSAKWSASVPPDVWRPRVEMCAAATHFLASFYALPEGVHIGDAAAPAIGASGHVDASRDPSSSAPVSTTVSAPASSSASAAVDAAVSPLLTLTWAHLGAQPGLRVDVGDAVLRCLLPATLADGVPAAVLAHLGHRDAAWDDSDVDTAAAVQWLHGVLRLADSGCRLSSAVHYHAWLRDTATVLAPMLTSLTSRLERLRDCYSSDPVHARLRKVCSRCVRAFSLWTAGVYTVVRTDAHMFPLSFHLRAGSERAVPRP
jgi:hypothetical protein